MLINPKNLEIGKIYRANGAQACKYIGERKGFPTFEFTKSHEGVDYTVTASFSWEDVNAAKLEEINNAK